VPFQVFEPEAVRANRCIRLLTTDHGGHLGFIGETPHRFWANEAIMDWIANRL